ncbi:hypothetical protein ACFQDZ_21130 [Sulfitobacter pacificus]|uniref:hypothetical protein n=1 Tax=Sulfitobacter pacificus TaxID=1499314 RepID=UPI00361B58FB
MSRFVWADEWQPYRSNDSPDTPYAHFDRDIGGISPQLRQRTERLIRNDPVGLQALRIARNQADDGLAAEDEDGPASEGSVDPAVDLLEEVLAIGGVNNVRPPLLADMVTGGLAEKDAYVKYVRKEGALPQFLKQDSAEPLPPEFSLADETVIVGVIDLGIGLGHRRTMMSDTNTRILAAWQQSADRTEIEEASGDDAQRYLPFGRELYAPKIDELICGHKDKDGNFDEESFNRACATEDYRALFGQRELGTRSSHGMHTLDLAAGLDLDNKEPALLGAVRLMVTNFPDRALVGHSAAFLEYFAVFAIWRMIRLADAIWDRNNPKACKDPDRVKGYRMVINLSFGKQASARDGTDLIALAMEKINDFRSDRPEVVLSIPAGNENLEQGNSKFLLSGGAEETIDWRIPPDDQSANFVEVWAEPVRGLTTNPSKSR